MTHNLVIEDRRVYYQGADALNINEVYCQRKFDNEKNRWVSTDRVFLCRANNPIVFCMTPNAYDKVCAKICQHIGAKCIYRNDGAKVYDEDPYGRSVPRWTIDKRIYDLRDMVGCSKELKDILCYEEYQLVKNYLGL